MDFLAPDIRLTVAAFMAAGFEVFDSADGQSTSEGDHEAPFLVVRSEAGRLVSDALHIRELLELNSIYVCSVGGEIGVQIEAMYDPNEDSALIRVTGVHDDLLPDVVQLHGQAHTDRLFD